MSLENRTLLNSAVGKPRLRIAPGSPMRSQVDAREAAARLFPHGWFDFTFRKHLRVIDGRVVERWSLEASHARITHKACFSLMPMRD